MTTAEAALRALITELVTFAKQREAVGALQNLRAARRVRAQVAEIELALEREEPLGDRELKELVAESRALLEDAPDCTAEGRIPPEDSGPVPLKSIDMKGQAAIAALAKRARRAMEDD